MPTLSITACKHLAPGVYLASNRCLVLKHSAKDLMGDRDFGPSPWSCSSGKTKGVWSLCLVGDRSSP